MISLARRSPTTRGRVCAAAARHDAQRHLGQREARAAHRIGEVAGQHGFQPAGIGMAVDRGDHRHRQVQQRVAAAFEDRVLVLPRRRRQALARLQVGAGAEDAVARTGQHDAAHLARIVGQVRPQIEQIEPHPCVLRIAHFRAVQRHLQQVLADHVGQDCFVGVHLSVARVWGRGRH
jgi:hypothetical protein